jgi:hypothetical protein
VSAPTQAQLDDFARRLHALETELEQLVRQASASAAPKAQAVTAEAAPVASTPPIAPPARNLGRPPERAPELLERRDAEAAVRELERLRARAFDARRVAELRDICELAHAAAANPSSAGARASAQRLVYAIEQNIRFLESAPQPTAAPLASERRPSRWRVFRRPTLTVSDLLGARALALAGGIVTLLGIVFFFVLAVNRGWIGPEGRVALGAVAALLAFFGGLELHRRYGETYSSLAAAGAGVAGGYATLLAAAALYDLVPDYAALVGAGAIAAVGVATSIMWRSQIVAALGLVGAMLVPVAVVAQGGPRPLGTAFVAVVFAATTAVSLRFGWRRLLVAGVAASAPQILALVLQPEYHDQAPAQIVLLAAAFSLLYAATGILSQVRSSGESLDPLASSLTGGAAALAAVSATRLFGPAVSEGLALLVVAAAYAGAAAFFFTRPSARPLSALLAALAFVAGGFAFADLLSGRPLAYAWAAESAALAWLARRVREVRFQVWSATYFLLCAGHVLVVDAPPSGLFVETGQSAAEAAAAAAAVALAATAFRHYATPWLQGMSARGLFPRVDRLVARFRAQQTVLRSASFWVGAAFAAYSVSLAAIALCSSFAWAFVAVTAIWSLAGLTIAVAGLRGGSLELRQGSALWLVTVSLAVLLHCTALTGAPRWWSLLVLAAVLFAAGLACELVDPEPSGETADVAACAATAAVVIGAVSAGGLLGGPALACAWAVESVALAACARRLRTPHLVALAALPLALAVGHSLAFEAPPQQLFVDTGHPARGILTVLSVSVAAAASAAQLRPWIGEARAYGRLATAMSALGSKRRVLQRAWCGLAGLAAAYAVSLGTLALFESFDWGWVAVTAIWCALGLAVLGAGLRLESLDLRAGGLVCLAAATSVVVVEGAFVLAESPRCAAFAVVATALLITALAYARRARGEKLEPISAGATIVSLALSCYSIVTLLDGQSGGVDLEGLGLLGLAALYGSIAAALLRRRVNRDLATLFWGISLVLGGVAVAKLLDGTATVLAWSGASVMLAWLATRTREPRFLAGAFVFVAVSLTHALVLESPPSHLFVPRIDPGAGSPAVFFSAAALAAVAYLARNGSPVPAGARVRAGWLAGVLAVYGLSLTILQAAESFFHAGLDTEYQRGHTAVSAFWGLLGLVLLYAGLTRWRRLRLAGLALFALSLGKIFLYDLPSLSSIERALSFLAVGAVLLLGGFFYQRLSAGDVGVAGDPGR